MRFQKMIAGLLAVSMLTAPMMTAAPVLTVCAEQVTSGSCGETASWSYDEGTGTLTISGSGAMYDFGGSEDAKECGWSDYSFSVQEIVIEPGITYVGRNAFAMCSSATAVSIPDSVTALGALSFDFTKALTEIRLPEHLETIGDRAFFGTGVREITIPASVTSIGSSVFYGCTELTSVTFLNPELPIEQYTGFICNRTEQVDESYNNIFEGVIYGYAGSTAETFAQNAGYTFAVLGSAPAVPAQAAKGDVNLDGKVDSSDAAELLIALAKLGAGEDSGLDDTQLAAGDVDGSGEKNAGDATIILQYAAFIGAGGTGTLPEFLANQ